MRPRRAAPPLNSTPLYLTCLPSLTLRSSPHRRRLHRSRPTEVDLLLGNPAKAERLLGWKRKITFPELVKGMVEADMQLVAKGDLTS